MNVILFEPEIPQNTGNIVRTCKATRSSLTLVKPLGFSVTDKKLRRAGLDYWDGVDVKLIDDLKIFLENETKPFYFLSSKANTPYTEMQFEEDCHIIFGSESKGLSPYFFETYPDRFCTIPMAKEARCLNLSNSVAIVLYEAARQRAFAKITWSAERSFL